MGAVTSAFAQCLLIGEEKAVQGNQGGEEVSVELTKETAGEE